MVGRASVIDPHAAVMTKQWDEYPGAGGPRSR